MYMAINDEHGDIESEGIQPGLSPIGRPLSVRREGGRPTTFDHRSQ